MGWLTGRRAGQGGPPPLPAGPHRYAVVDVETTGLHPRSCRVLSVAALALDQTGRPEKQLVSLVDPGCDPGPVHIHGLTRKRLAGAPRFATVLPELQELLQGRVLVAHNAAFDHGFLHAEALRAGSSLPTRDRLCTVALSRRLGVDVPDHKLGTLTRHWGVRHERAHDAHSDALALAHVFAHSVDLATRLGLPLPVVPCQGKGPVPYPASPMKGPCPWRCPGPWSPGEPLVQGMKVAITGETRTPRELLVDRLSAAGLDVTGSVSRLTSLLVRDPSAPLSTKYERARVEGVAVVPETALLALLEDVRPGVPKAAAPRRAPRPEIRAAGPLAGRRVLVVGGTHDRAAAVRGELARSGAASAVNLSASVTDLVVLPGGEQDPRVARARAAGVRVHAGAIGPAPAPADARPAVLVLPRGGAIDLPGGRTWTVNVAWRAEAPAVDVLAFLVDDSHRVVTDEDLVFYNAPVSEHGAVSLAVDGDSEQSVRIDLDLLPEHCSRVVVAAAIDGGCTFGELGAVALSVDAEDRTAVTATLDAGTTERTLLLAELYRREGVWRVRAVGQGYDDGLAALATRFGVVVD